MFKWSVCFVLYMASLSFVIFFDDHHRFYPLSLSVLILDQEMTLYEHQSRVLPLKLTAVCNVKFLQMSETLILR